MKIIAVDPGTTESAYVIYEDGQIGPHGKLLNTQLVQDLSYRSVADILVVEMIASFGMPAGQTMFETCVWIGEFIRALPHANYSLLYRREIKQEICGSSHAGDANIRQALIDKFGPPGTKKNPGPTYGFKSDMWAALAVAVTFEEMGHPMRKLLADDPKELDKWTKKQDEKREKRKRKKAAK